MENSNYTHSISTWYKKENIFSWAVLKCFFPKKGPHSIPTYKKWSWSFRNEAGSWGGAPPKLDDRGSPLLCFHASSWGMNNYYSIGIVPCGQLWVTALVKTSGGGLEGALKRRGEAGGFTVRAYWLITYDISAFNGKYNENWVFCNSKLSHVNSAYWSLNKCRLTRSFVMIHHAPLLRIYSPETGWAFMIPVSYFSNIGVILAAGWSVWSYWWTKVQAFVRIGIRFALMGTLLYSRQLMLL
jgi:hypothetical protein